MNDVDISDSLLPVEYKLVSVYDLHKAIEKEYGKEAADSFGAFAIDKVLPINPLPLIEFFTGRVDEISKTCLATLMETQNAN